MSKLIEVLNSTVNTGMTEDADLSISLFIPNGPGHRLLRARLPCESSANSD